MSARYKMRMIVLPVVIEWVADNTIDSVRFGHSPNVLCRRVEREAKSTVARVTATFSTLPLLNTHRKTPKPSDLCTRDNINIHWTTVNILLLIVIILYVVCCGSGSVPKNDTRSDTILGICVTNGILDYRSDTTLASRIQNIGTRTATSQQPTSTQESLQVVLVVPVLVEKYRQ